MAEISKKIRQSKVLCGENKIPYARAVTLMSLFTFTFLGAEFLFVNIIARTASGNLSVNAQTMCSASAHWDFYCILFSIEFPMEY